MANVAFKQGPAARLKLSTFTPENGTFYFTTDSHKLYLGHNNDIVDLTHFINYVDTRSQLPSTADEGDLYYVKSENIFCIRNNSSTSPYYTQINPDTQLTADNGGAVDVDAIETSGTQTGVTVTTSVSDTANNTATGDFSIVAGNGNVHITNSGNTISISTDNSSDDHQSALSTVLNTSAGTIRLTESLNSTETGHDDIVISGSGQATVTSTANNAITINVPVQDVVNSLSFDANGVLTSNASLGASQDDDSVTPTIAYGKPATAGGTPPESEVFASGTATLDVYTTGQVDNLLAGYVGAVNAMHYKGTINSSTGPTLVSGTTGDVGDVYKVSAAFTSGGVDYKAGDLVIAKANGNSIAWERIPSADDQMIGGSVATSYFEVVDSLSGSNSSLLKVNLAESSSNNVAKINVTGVVDDAGTAGVGAEVTYTFSHGTAGTGVAQTFTTTATNPTADSNFNVTKVASTLDVYSISGISLDAAGHVASITTSKYAIKDTHNRLDDVSASVAVANNGATITVSASDIDGGGDSDNFYMSSSSLTITAPSNTTQEVAIDLVWGTF